MQAEEQGARKRRHGATAGGAKPALYQIWCGIRRRCEDEKDPAFFRYGGRGIRVCERWRADFTAFEADMGPRPSPRHSVDRIDGSKGYEPGNCRWATAKEQARNRCNNRMVSYRGEVMPLSALAERVGMRRDLLDERLGRGWDVERAVSVAPRAYRRRGAAVCA